jgi:PAS domain S-box-containing protein
MNKGFFKSLQFRIFLITVVSLIPFISFTIYDAEIERKRNIENLKSEALQLVNFTLIEEARTIEGSRQLLISLSNLANEYYTNPTLCKNYFSSLLAKFRRYVNLGIVDKNGFLFASGRQFESRIDYSQNEFFKEAIRNNEFAIGEYFLDPVSHKKIINMGYPIFDDKKRIKAVLFASLDVEYIDVIEKKLAKIFHEKSLFIKTDDKGNILATHSTSNELIKSIINPLLLKSILRQETGIIETPGPNNQKYLFVFTKTSSTLFQQNLHLIIGVNREDFFSEINKTLYKDLFLIGVLFVIFLVSVLIYSEKYILKSVKKLIRATNERAAGNLKIRSNVDYDSGELGQLAMSFDRMAETLEKQNNERSKMEENLRESEERFRNLFEHSPVSLWLEDHSEIKRYIDQLRITGVEDFKMYFQAHPEELANCVSMLKVVDVNKATLQLYQAKSKEDLLKGLLIIFRKESYAVFTEELIALTSGKTMFECEADTQTLTGKRKYVIFKLFVLPGYEETWSKVLVSMTDITERKQAEAQIRFQASLLEQVSNGVAVVDNEGKLIYWNHYAEILHGWKSEEVIGKSALDFLVSEKQKKLAQELINSILQEERAEVEIPLLKKNGEEFPAHVSYSVLRNASGEPIGILGISIDISERKRTEMLLREALERLQTIIQASPLAILAIDPNGKIMNWNAGAEQMFGWSEKETVGKVCPTVPSEWLSDFHDMITQVVQGKTFSGLLRYRQKKDGTLINVSITTAPLRNAEGKAIGAIAILEDVSERIKSEEERNKLLVEIQKADKQLRILSRRIIETQEAEKKIISRELHDEIGQTLTAAKMTLQSIQRNTKSPKLKEELEVTISYLEQSLQQVRNISLNLRPSILDDLGIEAALHWLIKRISESTEIKFDLKFNLYGFELPKDLQLNCYRVAQEALNNIVKHSEAKKVVISLNIIVDSVHLKIKDDGKGFNMHEVREEAMKGKSLGILSMEERVQLAGGEFKIISTEKNGTEVQAIFPLPKQ